MRRDPFTRTTAGMLPPGSLWDLPGHGCGYDIIGAAGTRAEITHVCVRPDATSPVVVYADLIDPHGLPVLGDRSTVFYAFTALTEARPHGHGWELTFHAYAEPISVSPPPPPAAWHARLIRALLSL